ncbi:MAG: transglutaminase domain-containing protein [Bacteroidota bacterium]
MVKKLLFPVIFMLISSGFLSFRHYSEEHIMRYFMEGNFSKAEQLISEKLKSNPDKETRKELEIIRAKMYRIELDFSKSESDIKKELLPYFPELSDKHLRKWEKAGKLEMRIINSERKYFRNAVANLFRLDKQAALVKEKKDGKIMDPLKKFCIQHTSELIRKAKNGKKSETFNCKFQIDFSITLKPDVIPAGETVKCWLPFPRKSLPRQKNIELLEVNSSNYFLASNSTLQRNLYIEKKTKAGKSTIFSYSALFETRPQWFQPQNHDIKPYHKNSELFREYTAERPPHITFSEEIKQLAGEITSGKTNSYENVKAIYYWIDENIPWASALEYSTFENIPEYVLKNRHGDCGMQTLLFMSLARASGIPCKWQSGWMLHPGEVNLHDWCEVYYEGVGWVPLDQSFGLQKTDNQQIKEFYISGIDGYRLIINDDFSREFNPPKEFFRSEPIDFQRGELEWSGGNIYFDKWKYKMDIKYLKKGE